jgi:hypothetical protein
MCPCAPPRIRRTCCTASTAKWQVLENTQKAGCYTYFRGLDVTFEHRSGVDFFGERFERILLAQIARFARNDNVGINKSGKEN